ncbi:class I SAM-dependent methyltransferase [Roseimaritima sediminicola]|uniref:class I SAM-dependent methyltransferase n=1 Tax=Roseimaritima sediminicola TaxID=2662066 RepID=UPI0012984FD0|nr:class I SAM-dependent methyltransferase [Roseimaritima sediminicola]
MSTASADPQLQDEEFWSEKWIKHIETYLTADPRTGRWLQSRFNLCGQTVLEVAGGSCRDSRFLHEQGVDATGSDFDARTLQYLRDRDKASEFRLRREDAFALDCESKSFDVVFHNGFWVLFDDDEKLVDSLREHVRVARRYVVILVHNKRNRKLVDTFSRKGKTDALYNIRFFTPEEVRRLCNAPGLGIKRVHIEKFGGPLDGYYGNNRRIPLPLRLRHYLIPKLYRAQPWPLVERVAAIIELEQPATR